MKKSKRLIQKAKSNLSRPPIVAVLGHVDHGKTTLLDAIRQSNQAALEYGGITQQIGAYQIELDTKEGKRQMTFIDTPGHEAFSEMRSRGAQVTDLVVLVISAVDGVKPQTEESIKHIQKAQVPFIVAATKMDSPQANLERVKKQLAKIDILTEGNGGDVVVVPVSAVKKTGIKELLDMILLVAEMNGVKGSEKDSFSGVIIESKLDLHRGPSATILIKTGQLKTASEVFINGGKVKIRAMFDEYGRKVDLAGPSKPVDVLGFSKIPPVGSIISLENNQPKIEINIKTAHFEKDKEHLKIILKADTNGALETIVNSLIKDIEIIEANLGNINEADVLKAKACGALVIGFNVRIGKTVQVLAQEEKVLVKTYNIVYELFEELTEVSEVIREGEKEIIQGKGNVMAVFPFDSGKVAGILVTEGKLTKGDKVKLLRNNQEVGLGRILTLRIGKDEVPKVEQGKECGARLSSNIDFSVRDVLLSVKAKQIVLK